ncbi:hypothetical protein [Ferrimonas sp. YFM]|uniref:hypothetical protein n=1 Tax=Ferrimonas sp. YFM TaxID=3028878 RepID=UPI002572DB13|nr:hypothetical protein [Ferrimonas sp. YFM]BDY04555.1 hypothetical protein F0521_15960 [Ferrimonas sp. YFM]
MSRTPLSALLLAALLGGCGSDDGDVEVPQPEPQPPQSPYLTVDVTPQAVFEGQFQVFLGRYPDLLKDWLQSDAARDLNGDGHIDERDAHLDGVYNPDETPIIVQAAEMDRVLRTNPDGLGAGSARPDIFVDGHYSVFDALRYLAATRADLKLEQVQGPAQTGRDTHDFVVSWDRNGDGVFDENDDDIYANFQGAHWYSRLKYDGGELIKLNGTLTGLGPQGEAHYERLDQIWVQPQMTIRFQPFSPEMTARRYWVQQQEMARLSAGGGKVVLPQLQIMKPGEPKPVVIPNLEVTAHNMRPDIFQPGVITKMDIFLSAADAGLDVAFNYWPSLSTGARVEHFALFRVDGIASQVGRGWATVYGDMAVHGDFSPTSQCNFSSPQTGGMDLLVDPEHCRLDWNANFGGNIMHMMSDTWVMNQPVQFTMLVYKSHYELFGMEEYNGKTSAQRDFSEAQDGSDIMTLQTFSLPGDGPLLTDSHFGWGIADCTECHNEQKQPMGHGGHSWPVNSADGFDQTQPYYCATCHGSNGAPMGHEETARCFWCHAGESNTPKHHGEASTRRLYQGEQIKSNDKIYNDPNELNALPRDKDGNYQPYEKVWSSVNSDWDMSRVFPDPYSCMTCHPNED